MARIASHEGLQPSMLDRLIDPDSEGTSWRRGYSVEQMIDSVRATTWRTCSIRTGPAGLPEEFIEVRQSIVTYGLSGSGLDPKPRGPTPRSAVCTAIEEVITMFEPRLADVHAKSLTQAIRPKTLQAGLPDPRDARVDPSPEVAFVTLLKLTDRRDRRSSARAGER